MTTPSHPIRRLCALLGRWRLWKIELRRIRWPNTPTASILSGCWAYGHRHHSRRVHCAVLDDGSVVCWGRNDYGQLGDGTLQTACDATISLGRPAVAVEAESFLCMCIARQRVCLRWGRNHKEPRGVTRTQRLILSTNTGVDPSDARWTAGGGPRHQPPVCAVLGNGHACWGQYGGGNTPRSRPSSVPQIQPSTFLRPLCRLWAVGQRERDLLGTG